MLYIASDHGGFKLKAKVVEFLTKELMDFEDLGPDKLVPGDDYVETSARLVEKVRSDKKNHGILICRNGVGVCIFANKFKGIRAALSWKPEHVVTSRNDDNSNILTLPADYIDTKTALEIVGAWLITPFSNAERHIRRVTKLDELGQA
jgi:RpiB/LacA/LacB family sugar-phosphate isomerase